MWTHGDSIKIRFCDLAENRILRNSRIAGTLACNLMALKAVITFNYMSVSGTDNKLQRSHIVG